MKTVDKKRPMKKNRLLNGCISLIFAMLSSCYSYDEINHNGVLVVTEIHVSKYTSKSARYRLHSMESSTGLIPARRKTNFSITFYDEYKKYALGDTVYLSKRQCE